MTEEYQRVSVFVPELRVLGRNVSFFLLVCLAISVRLSDSGQEALNQLTRLSLPHGFTGSPFPGHSLMFTACSSPVMTARVCIYFSSR